MFFDFPEKKDFEKDDKLNYKKNFTLIYKQSTIWEFIEFFKKNELEKNKFLEEIIFNCIYKNKFKKFLRKFWIKNKIEKYLNFEQIKTEILKNKFKSYESKFAWLDKNSKNSESLFSFYLILFYQNFWLKPQDVLNLTLEQFNYLMDWVIFYNNLKTKEWQSKNNFALWKKKVDKRKFEKNKQYFENKKAKSQEKNQKKV